MKTLDASEVEVAPMITTLIAVLRASPSPRGRPPRRARVDRARGHADGRERVASREGSSIPAIPHMGQRSAQKTDGAGSVATLGKSSRSNWSVMRSGASSAARRFKAPASCSAESAHHRLRHRIGVADGNQSSIAAAF